MQVLVKNWLVGAEKTEVAHLWAAVNVWLKYRSYLAVEIFLKLTFSGLGRRSSSNSGKKHEIIWWAGPSQQTNSN